MDNTVGMVVFFFMFILYWRLIGELVGGILESPGLKTKYWIFPGMFNTLILAAVWSVYPDAEFSFGIMMVLMLAEFVLFFRDRFTGALLCALACGFHVVAEFIIVLGILFLNTGRVPLDILTDTPSFLQFLAGLFLLLNLCILGVLKIVPLSMVKLINHHKEQQWFMNVWMIVSTLCLLYMENLIYRPSYSAGLAGSQVVVSVTLLADLYIVLFFSIKTSNLLGYREKNEELQQAIEKEQEYRGLMVRDAIASYEVNVTQDLILKGFEEQRGERGGVPCSYTDMLLLMSRQIIYSEDIAAFIRGYGRANVLQLYERGERELVTEYRRLLENDEFIWVRSIINLLKDAQTGDVKAFVCVKNIDGEKKKQLELQHLAESDPLTGLYNRSFAELLIDKHFKKRQTVPAQPPAASAFFMIDVDNFKEVNDHMGHIFGDAVLRELADHLVHIFNDQDISARIGGDEYIVFLKDCATTQTVEEKAKEICKAFSITYQCNDTEAVTISASIGIAFSPRDGSNFLDLYSCADIALYSVKNGRKNGYEIYDSSNFAVYASREPSIQRECHDNHIEYVFRMLYHSDNPAAAIHSVLELVARNFSFERGYVFEIAKDGKSFSNTCEWCADGVTPRIDILQFVPITALESINNNFRQHGAFIVKSPEDTAPPKPTVQKPKSAKSIMQFSISDKQQQIGFIGFDSYCSETAPEDAVINKVKTICSILAAYIVRRHIDEASANNLLARQEVMDHLDNYIYVINAETFELLFMNRKIQELKKRANAGDACYRFFRGKAEQCDDCPIREMLKTGSNHISCEMYNDMLGIWMETSASLLRWSDGNLVCLLNCTDITKQKGDQLLHVHELEQLLYVDVLTGCPTYHRFQIEARRILEQQEDRLHLLIKLDIDNFKLINQMYGYEKGNDILCSVAKALAQTARGDGEIYARMGNDEFVALFAISGETEIEELSESFLSHFHQLAGNRYSFKFRFPQGRYLITPDAAKHMDIHDMYEKANTAHNAAKLGKIIDFAVYDESMTKDALRIKIIENKMTQALADHEFCVYLQPKYYLKDETIGGAEALTRWKINHKDLFFPDAFIPIFEQNGFITKLDFYVFEKTCETIKLWITQGIKPVTVSVNFSRLHIDNPNFIKKLCEIVDSVGIERKYLEIEITETVIFDNIDQLEILLDEIHKNGFSMSMDDFGSGYSSLGMLKDISVDIIKMDRSFFVNQRDESRSRIVVDNVIKMANELGIRIVAEGVEEQAHIDFLRELNCDMVQGYYYAKPMPVAEFTKLLCRERGRGPFPLNKGN